jgi:hypothetical protein
MMPISNSDPERIEFDLGTPGSGIGDIKIAFEGSDLKVEYEFTKNGDFVGNATFENTHVFRFRDELRSRGFIEESYDTVIKVIESSWLGELRALDASGMDDLEGLHHFAVFLSSNGYLEVIAEKARLGAPRAGTLAD